MTATGTRRSILRGTLGGAAVGVALPYLDYFTPGAGRAAAAGVPRFPVRFGTWIWGCGFVPQKWVPRQVGRTSDLPADLAPLAPFRDRLAILSGFDVKLDGVPNKPHVTGCLGLRTGVPVPNRQVKAPTFDVLISDVIGKATRFKSLEISTSGANRSYSYQAASSPNPSETSPLALYRRIFGAGFQNPNDTKFTPDPYTMARQSVLSAVTDERRSLLSRVGVEDRRRLDEYFSAIRQLERQLASELQPPAPVENFTLPDPPSDHQPTSEMETVLETHRLMAKLLARALQCNQTRVFNMLLSDTASNLRRRGSTTTHHTLTHEEPEDPELGYQREVAWFATQSMIAWRDFLAELAAIPEGDGTLLDNCVIVAHSDCSIAKAHAVEGIPVMVAGSGGGRIRTGFHLAGNADPITRVGLTIQQVMGVPVERWGAMSMETSRTIGELIA